MAPIKVLAFFALLVAAVGVAESARILVTMPIVARSHHIAVSAVAKALVDRGHDVTYVTGLDQGNKINPAKAKIVSVSNPFVKEIEKSLKDFWKADPSPITGVKFIMDWGAQIANNTLSDPSFKAEVFKPGQKYDLIISELFFFQEAFAALGHKFNAPVVAINPFGTSQFINDLMGNPTNPSYVASPFLGFSDRMTFVERLINTLLYVGNKVAYKFYALPLQQKIVEEHFPDSPPLEQVLRERVGLTLVNNHFTLTYPAPMSPNVIEIGGIHVPPKPKPLPKDLQDYLDSAKNGVVYFSMGSNLRMEHMPDDQKEAILGALGALKEKVLLKWDGAKPKTLSPNIRLIEWAPQGDLLAHPNVRAFFTHGGLLSTQESVFHGVPLVGMPMFGDQKFNMLIAEKKGFCVKIDFRSLSRETLDAALKEILTNPKYKENAKRLSRLFRSKAVQPIDAAVFSVEHVLEHGADHLRPSSVDLPLYQLLLLDVFGALALAVLLPLLLLRACCRALCCGKKQQRDVPKGKKKN